MKVYFDNAATTPIDPQVIAEMEPYLHHFYGNPSSIHSHGREVRAVIEKVRKTIADILNVSPAEIFFTSGGTEADNTYLKGAAEAYYITDIITTRTEHHAVLHTVEYLAASRNINLHFLNLDERGIFEISELEDLLHKADRPLVTLMHGNNEIGNLLSLEEVLDLCKHYQAVFHSDTVQTVGHFNMDLQATALDSIVASAHKFHGPKGIGFLYLKNPADIHPFILGGSQERNFRGGTENVYGIVGLGKAMELAYSSLEDHKKHILGLKTHMIERLDAEFPGISYYGRSAEADHSLYTLLSVSLPPSDLNEMLLFNLDIHGISASGGSACTSGSDVGSHVINAINPSKERAVVRFSFSKMNTLPEVDYVVDKLKEIYAI